MFPTSLDDLSTTRATSGAQKLSSPDHLAHHLAEDTLIEALQAKIGVNNSAVATSLDYILKSANSINPGHKHNFLSALDGVPAQAVYVDAAGNVGIGTTGPLGELEVFSSDGVASDLYVHSDNGNANIYLDGSTGNAQIYFENSGVVKSLIRQTTATGDNLNIYGVGVGEDMVTFDTTNGNVGIATTIPTAKLDINSDIIRLRIAKTPASAGAAGNAGDICWDADFVYVCVATNTWKKVAIATW